MTAFVCLFSFQLVANVNCLSCVVGFFSLLLGKTTSSSSLLLYLCICFIPTNVLMVCYKLSEISCLLLHFRIKWIERRAVALKKLDSLFPIRIHVKSFLFILALSYTLYSRVTRFPFGEYNSSERCILINAKWMIRVKELLSKKLHSCLIYEMWKKTSYSSIRNWDWSKPSTRRKGKNYFTRMVFQIDRNTLIIRI